MHTRKPMRTAASLLLLGSALAAASSAWGSSAIDAVEHLFGATNVHAITGHGRLTVGESRDGDLTVLVWPNPSYSDQLAYLSSNALDAREAPRLGAEEGAGVVLGLRVDLGAEGTEVTWFRDTESWTSQQTYGPADGANIETSFRSDSLGLSVLVTDAVAPVPPDSAGEGDVLVRHVRVTRDTDSPVVTAHLLVYANLSPMPPNSHVSELPVADWAMDGRNDFAAVWDAEAAAVIHFHPDDQRIFVDPADFLAAPAVDFGPIGAALEGTDVSAEAVATLAAELDTDYQPGAYLALTTIPAPDQHQVGFDETPFCDQVDDLIDNLLAIPDQFPGISLPIDAGLLDSLRCNLAVLPTPARQGWTYEAADAWADAADGELSGASLAAGEVNVALRTPLAFIEGGNGRQQAEAALVIGVGPRAHTAREAAASVDDPADVLAASEAALADWLADRRLVQNDSERVRQVARRSLINVRVGTVAQNGAIVASIARQPSYGLDWPRDGAFFEILLDATGQSDLVDRRAALYAGWQRTEPVQPTPLIDLPPPTDPESGRNTVYPAGAWEMNYTADGLPGGTFRFEIDNTGFALWGLVAHIGWLPEGERAAYLESYWTTIELAANLLARWRDPETGLHAPAQEDDNAAYTQTLHGAVTTFAALDIAGRAARLLGRDDQAEAWEARALELRDAILGQLYDDDQRRFVSEGNVVNPGSAPTGPTAWLVWPMRLLDWADPRIEPQLRFDLDLIAPTIAMENEGGGYVMKNTLSAALALGDDPEVRAELQTMLESLASQATEGTHHFGEVMIVTEGEDGRGADQRVSTPHLWEGTLFFLTALALEDPTALLAYELALPPSRLPAAAPPPWAPAPEDEGDEPSADAGDPGGDTQLGGGGGDGCDCATTPRSSVPPLALAFALLALVGRAARRS